MSESEADEKLMAGDRLEMSCWPPVAPALAAKLANIGL